MWVLAYRYSSLIHSQVSRGSTSRKVRVFSRAWRTQAKIDDGLRSSWMRKLITAVSLASS